MATVPPLDRDVIHIWRLPIDETLIPKFFPGLTPEEQTRAARFRFPRDRAQFVGVRGWLRLLLGRYLDRRPNDLTFRHGPEGKPRLDADRPELHFNVSHTPGFGLLAFSRGREIGVDVERLDSGVDLLELAATCFSPVELDAFHAAPPVRRTNEFFRYWTAKEAYIKALGGGMSIPLQEFSVVLRSDHPRWEVIRKEESPSLSVHEVAVPEGFAGAVAAPVGEWSVRILDLPV